MLMLAVVVLCTGTALAAAMVLSWPAFVFLCVCVGQAAASGKFHCPRLRTVPFVRTLMGARFLGAPPTHHPGRRHIFACEPHGLACCHLSLFANPGRELELQRLGRIRVIASSLAFAVPLVQLVYGLAGITDCSRERMEKLLLEDYDLALSPSGVPGKEHAVQCTDTPGGDISVLRRCRIPGFVRLAARHGCVLVPVLSPDENVIYRKAPTGTWWPFVPVWGRFFFWPLQQHVDVICGEAIDCCDYDANDEASLLQLADRFYTELSALAPAGRKVVLCSAQD